MTTNHIWCLDHGTHGVYTQLSDYPRKNHFGQASWIRLRLSPVIYPLYIPIIKSHRLYHFFTPRSTFPWYILVGWIKSSIQYIYIYPNCLSQFISHCTCWFNIPNCLSQFISPMILACLIFTVYLNFYPNWYPHSTIHSRWVNNT